MKPFFEQLGINPYLGNAIIVPLIGVLIYYRYIKNWGRLSYSSREFGKMVLIGVAIVLIATSSIHILIGVLEIGVLLLFRYLILRNIQFCEFPEIELKLSRWIMIVAGSVTLISLIAHLNR